MNTGRTLNLGKALLGFAVLLAFWLPQNRVWGQTYIVNSTSDVASPPPGTETLRSAIIKANATPSATTKNIQFSIPGPGPHTIVLTSPLPFINRRVNVQGQTQPGYTLGNPKVWINGGGFGHGLRFDVSGDKSTVEGLRIFGVAGPAIHSAGSDDMFIRNNVLVQNVNGVLLASVRATVQGNWIGTDAAGASGLGNSNYGVLATVQHPTGQAVATDHLIGGSAPGQRNTIHNSGLSNVSVEKVWKTSIRSNIIINSPKGINLNYTTPVQGNSGKPAPVITAFNPAGVSSPASLVGVSEPTDLIEIFVGDATGQNAFSLVGTATTSGTGSWSYVFSSPPPPGTIYVATATKTSKGTSEFSSSFTVPSPITLCSSFSVYTKAGDASSGTVNDLPLSSSFVNPWDAVALSSGVIFVTDAGAHNVRQIPTTGSLATFVGSGAPGFADGTGAAAKFNQPRGICTDGAGNLYVADYANHRIRKITPAGVVTTIAGTGVAASGNGPASLATFNGPSDVAFLSPTVLLVAETNGNRIRAINLTTMLVSTYAGTGAAGSGTGPKASATFTRPVSLDVQFGQVLVADEGTGPASTMVRNIAASPPYAVSNLSSLYFIKLGGVQWYTGGFAEVTDNGSHAIYRLSPTGIITIEVGTSGSAGYVDGFATKFDGLHDLCISDFSGDIFIADGNNHLLRSLRCPSDPCAFGGQPALVELDGPAAFATLPPLTGTELFSWHLTSVPVASATTQFVVQVAPPMTGIAGGLLPDWAAGTSLNIPVASPTAATIYSQTITALIPPSAGDETWFWRVGYKYTPGAAITWSAPSQLNLDGPGVSIASSYVLDDALHTNNINWRYQSVYMDNGVIREGIVYIDGLGMTRQNQALMKSEGAVGEVLTSEVAYSEEGGGAVRSMVAPRGGNKFGYAHRYMDVYDASTGWSDFSTEHFDREIKGSAAPFTPAKLDQTIPGSVGHYYGPAGPEARVDDSEGWAFAYGLGYKEPMGRPMLGSGPGGTFVMGAGKETKTFYLQPSQAELDRVYGKPDAPDHSNIGQTIVMDANGVGYVSYTDREGQTIATALTTCNVSNMDPLHEDGMNDFSQHITIDNSVLDSTTLEVRGQTTFFIPCEDTEVELNFSADVGVFEIGGGNCRNCQWDVELRIVNDATGEEVYAFTDVIEPGTALPCGSPSVTIHLVTAHLLTLDGPATYTLTRTLRPHVNTVTGLDVLEETYAWIDSLRFTSTDSLYAIFLEDYLTEETFYLLRQTQDPPGPMELKIDSCLQVTTLAGGPLTVGDLDGPAATAKFNLPGGQVYDAFGNLYFTDRINRKIKKVTPAGVVSTIAGSGGSGFADGPAASATFTSPMGLDMDATGDLYVTDQNRIRKISFLPSLTVTTLAIVPGCAGAPTINQFGIVVDDATGDIYTTSFVCNQVWRLPSGSSSASVFVGSTTGVAGTVDAVGTSARMRGPWGIAKAASGDFYVSERINRSLRRISPAGAVVTVAGSPTTITTAGYNDVAGPAAQFSVPAGLVALPTGEILMADGGVNHAIRKYDPAGPSLTTFAGGTLAGTPYAGYVDGLLSVAKFKEPQYLALRPDGAIGVSDINNNALREIEMDSCGVTCVGVSACASFSLRDFTNSLPGDPSYSINIKVGPTSLITLGTIFYVPGLDDMATAIVDAINAGTSTHGFTASNEGGSSNTVIICAPESLGSSANGKTLELNVTSGSLGTAYNPDPYRPTRPTLFTGGYDAGDCERYIYYVDEVDTTQVPYSTYAGKIQDADGDVNLDGLPGDELYGYTSITDLGLLDYGIPSEAAIIDRFRAAWYRQNWEWLEVSDVELNLLQVGPGSEIDPVDLALLNPDKTLNTTLPRPYYLLRATVEREACDCEPREFPYDCEAACDERLLSLDAEVDAALADLDAHPTTYDDGTGVFLTLGALVDLSMPLSSTVLGNLDAPGLDLYFAYHSALTARATFDYGSCVAICEGVPADSCELCKATWKDCFADKYFNILTGYNYLMSNWTGGAASTFPYTLDDLMPINPSSGVREPDPDLRDDLGFELFQFFVDNPVVFTSIKVFWEQLGETPTATCANCNVPAHAIACGAGPHEDLSLFPTVLIGLLNTEVAACQETYEDCFRMNGDASAMAQFLCEQNLENCIASLGAPTDTYYTDPLSPGYGLYATYLANCSTSYDCGDPDVVLAMDSTERMLAILATVNPIVTDVYAADSIADTLYNFTIGLTLPELHQYLTEWEAVYLCELECEAVLLTEFNEWLDTYLNTLKSEVRHNFIESCFGNLNEHLALKYKTSLYHYTLYNYDRANDLASTVPPDGIDFVDIEDPNPINSGRTPVHRMPTIYDYNSVRELRTMTSPDGGTWRYLYDKAGRIRFSQNDEQVARSISGNVIFTYYKYEGETTRMFEMGEHFVGSFAGFSRPAPGPGIYVEDFVEDYSFPSGPSSTHQEVTIEYDDPSAIPGFTATFTERRISKSCSDDACTHFSYDAHGRLLWLSQEIFEFGAGVFKTIEYDFQPVSSLVDGTVYQRGSLAEDFRQRYTYDSDQHLTKVEISADGGINWTQAGAYDYFTHGPIKNVELGDDVQQVDYTFNLLGWLKAINHADLAFDPGKASPSAKDVFGMVLHYFEGDYKRLGLGLDAAAGMTPTSGTHVKEQGPNLYNGNISAWTTYTGFDQVPAMSSTPSILAQGFRYDVLNRLVGSHAETHTAGAFTGYLSTGSPITPGVDDFYRERLTYDPNGNILALDRTADLRPTTGTTAMDAMTYGYATAPDFYGNQKKINNRLLHVNDAAPKDPGLDDIADQGTWSPSVNDNYSYDAIGRLVRDNAEEIHEIQWSVYNKVQHLERNLGSSKLNLEFGYSANLNRVWKRVTEPGKPLSPETTIYVNDGMGNPVAIYRKETTPSGGFNYFLEDEFIVGQGRLGAIRRNVDVFTSVSLLSGSMLKERLMFELIDHLGSARAVVSGLKSVTGSAEVVSLQDHYPFGMEMPMRGFVGDAYRFGYERQEKMPELFMGCYTFEYREYDSRIGRFFHSDPLALNYAFYSPYQFSGNKVIIAPELEGLESASDQQVESGNPSPLPRTTTQENAIFIPNNASGTEFYADMDGLSRQIDWELGFVGVTSPEGKWEITSKLNTYMAMVENWKNPNHEGAISNLSIQDDEGNVIIVNFGFYLMGEDFVPENPEETVIVTTNYSASKGTSANTSHADDQSLSVTVSAGTGNEQGASASGKINDVGIGAESKQTLTTGLEATRIKGTTDASGQGSTADHRKDTEVQQPNTAMVGNAVFRVTYSFKKIYSNPDGGASLHEGHYFLHNVGSIKYFADRSASY